MKPKDLGRATKELQGLLQGRPLTLTWEDAHVPAILNVWFGGSETGKAVADALYGDVVPSGRLQTFSAAMSRTLEILETHDLGMEAIKVLLLMAWLQNGYLGAMLQARLGNKNWDFIVVHESGHEGSATNHRADLAICGFHESSPPNSEAVVFIDYFNGKEASQAVMAVRSVF
ncbi:hypothetical protein FQA39_LY19416 [Lamprigera yunnana]|nr:hypothetical protein FQA39_LY19416 [Lamprigera yunnana]